MAKRRSFVPTSPACASMEARLAPSNIFGLGHDWDKMVSKLGIGHHKSHGNDTNWLAPNSATPAAATAHHIKAALANPALRK